MYPLHRSVSTHLMPPLLHQVSLMRLVAHGDFPPTQQRALHQCDQLHQHLDAAPVGAQESIVLDCNTHRSGLYFRLLNDPLPPAHSNYQLTALLFMSSICISISPVTLICGERLPRGQSKGEGPLSSRTHGHCIGLAS
jgi:hypothetical protein